MLFILADEDHMIDNTILWLEHYKVPFFRLDHRENFFIKNITISNDTVDYTLTTERGSIRFSDITSYWYRRGNWKINSTYIQKPTNSYEYSYNSFKASELGSLHRFLNLTLEKYKTKIGNFDHNDTSKLFNLTVASNLGIAVPDTLVTTSKKELRIFFDKYPSLITKSIHIPAIQGEGERYVLGTSLFDTDSMANCPDTFFPTLFQETIEKKYELRIFFIKGKLFASAIFSQNDAQTAVDFRNYNYDKQNRTPPYLLPSKLQQQLTQLMDQLNMDTGSIDMIVGLDNKYIFLEVNPVGMYSQVSIPCNYYLEKEIAILLKTIHGEEKTIT